MKTTKNIGIAKRMLTLLKSSFYAPKPKEATKTEFESFEDFNEVELLSGKEETINDYMELCGYSYEEAQVAYSNLSNY